MTGEDETVHDSFAIRRRNVGCTQSLAFPPDLRPPRSALPHPVIMILLQILRHSHPQPRQIILLYQQIASLQVKKVVEVHSNLCLVVKIKEIDHSNNNIKWIYDREFSVTVVEFKLLQTFSNSVIS